MLDERQKRCFLEGNQIDICCPRTSELDRDLCVRLTYMHNGEEYALQVVEDIDEADLSEMIARVIEQL